jgi:colanic acid/amylovoran biosynthesis glycosyltransferase
MRIAFIVSTFPEVSQTFVLNQITGLIDRGHDVEIYASGQNTAKLHLEVKTYQLLDRVHYRSRPSDNKALLAIQSVHKLCKRCIQDPRLLVRSKKIFERGSYTENVRALYLAASFLPSRASYDIIFCHFGPNGLRGALMRELGVVEGKLVTVFHGADVTRHVHRFGEDTYGWLFEVGDLFLPISDQWKHRLIQLGCDVKKLLVHRVGVDCNKFSFRPQTSAPQGHVHIVTIARLTEKKGVDLGIRAVAKLACVHRGIRYDIVGDGPCREDLARLVHELDLSGTVRLLGPKDHGEVIEILKSAHILLAPSVTADNGDQEGIPVALMEGMAMGVLVVSTQHSGIPELIQNGVSGLLAPERDVDGLVERLDYLIRHADAWPDMTRAAREQVEKYYDVGKLNDRLVAILEELRVQGG